MEKDSIEGKWPGTLELRLNLLVMILSSRASELNMGHLKKTICHFDVKQCSDDVGLHIQQAGIQAELEPVGVGR